MRQIYTAFLIFSFSLFFNSNLIYATTPQFDKAGQSAVVLIYHRFDEPKYPNTNTTAEQLDAHINELKTGGYTVLPLEEIIFRLRAGPPLPPKTVAITIDDAYRSIYDVAWPKFKAANLPITVFVATDPVDQGVKSYMSWQQITELSENGVNIGNHSASHAHMPNSPTSQSAKDIRRASTRLKQMLGNSPSLFAYPYGEVSLGLTKLIEAEGFMAAFGQQSGVIGSAPGYYNLPRFSLNEKYGNIDRFKLAVNSLPLKVSHINPNDPLIGINNPPKIRFMLDQSLASIRPKLLNCFLSSEGRAKINRTTTPDGETFIQIQAQKPFPKGRTRLNCTLPAENGRWRWYGEQYYVP